MSSNVATNGSEHLHAKGVIHAVAMWVTMTDGFKRDSDHHSGDGDNKISDRIRHDSTARCGVSFAGVKQRRRSFPLCPRYDLIVTPGVVVHKLSLGWINNGDECAFRN